MSVIFLEVSAFDGRSKNRGKRGSHTAQRRRRIPLLFQLRQTRLDASDSDVAQRQFTEGRQDVFFELIGMNAHRRFSQRQLRVRFPFGSHEFRERGGRFRPVLLLADRTHSSLENLERLLTFDLSDETNRFRMLNAVDRSVWFGEAFSPASDVAHPERTWRDLAQQFGFPNQQHLERQIRLLTTVLQKGGVPIPTAAA
jgi:hypothetical protein